MKYTVFLLLVVACTAFSQNSIQTPLQNLGSSQLPPKTMFVPGALMAEYQNPSTSPTSSGAPGSMKDMFEDQSGFEKKSVVKAVGLSLLLPGMGELYTGEYGTGKYFTMAEAGLWVGFAGFTSYATWTQNDARSFAAQHAGIPTSEQSDQYYIDIGDFISTDAYNVEILRERQTFKTYDPRSKMGWQWDNDNNRERYREMRVQSDESFNYARFTIAAVITNHIVSAINAGRLAIRHNHSVSESSLYDLHAGVNAPTGIPDGFTVSLSRTF